MPSTQLTCVNCRHSHMRCDRATPSCGRCSRSQLRCVYIPSRRGQRLRQTASSSHSLDSTLQEFVVAQKSTENLATDRMISGSASTSTASTSQPLSQADTESQISSILEYLESDTCGSNSIDLDWNMSDLMLDFTDLHPDHNSTQIDSMPTTPVSNLSFTPNESLVRLFYLHFHPAHPILPPWTSLLSQRPPDYLLRTIEYIARHYVTSSSSDYTGKDPSNDNQQLYAAIVASDTSVEKIQASVLLSITLHSEGQAEKSRNLLMQASEAAMKLGLHQQDCATKMSHGNATQAESLRRTWWELYVVDSLLGAMQTGGYLTLDVEKPDVFLPGPEESYNDALTTLSTITIRDIENRAFSDQEMSLSSAAYRVEAAMLLRDTLRCTRKLDTTPEAFRQVEIKISSWFYHLPMPEERVMHTGTSVDQMFFQAIMIAHCACIFLHIPQSNLLSSLPSIRELACGAGSPHQPPRSSINLHTLKANKAATSISELVCLPTPAINHTPIIICVLILSSLTQLAAYLFTSGTTPEDHMTYLTLNLGVLKSLGTTWSIATSSTTKLKVIIREAQSSDTYHVPPNPIGTA